MSQQRRIWNPLKHLRWSFSEKTFNGQKPLNTAAKKIHRRLNTLQLNMVKNTFLVGLSLTEN